MIVNKLFLAINQHGSVLFGLLLLFTFIRTCSASNDIHYNIADPGKFVSQFLKVFNLLESQCFIFERPVTFLDSKEHKNGFKFFY